jgi:hypothetical protein
MFTKAGIVELHTAMHERLDLLLHHIASVPEELLHKPIAESAIRQFGSNWCTS